QIVAREHRLDPGPLEVEADEAPIGSAPAALELKGVPADERGLREVDERAEADLERRVVLLGADRVTGAGVLGLDQDQAGLDARDIERADAGGTDAVRLASLPQRVPHVRRRAGVDPDLVAQVAGVPGSRDVDVDTR